MNTKRLTVQDLPNSDHWRDMARIPGAHRTDERGRRIKAATICKVTIGNKNKLLSIRGWDETKEPVILLDQNTRTGFNVDIGSVYEVGLRPARLHGYWLWAYHSADPAYRVPAQISIISLVLGVIGLILGIIGFFK